MLAGLIAAASRPRTHTFACSGVAGACPTVRCARESASCPSRQPGVKGRIFSDGWSETSVTLHFFSAEIQEGVIRPSKTLEFCPCGDQLDVLCLCCPLPVIHSFFLSLSLFSSSRCRKRVCHPSISALVSSHSRRLVFPRSLPPPLSSGSWGSPGG